MAWKPEPELRAMKRLYRKYIRDCSRRNVFFALTLEQFHKLTSSDCAYCDRTPMQKTRAYLYNGIDRVDPKKGYMIKNCVTACKECNFLKKNLPISFQEMRVMAQALKLYREANGIPITTPRLPSEGPRSDEEFQS